MDEFIKRFEVKKKAVKFVVWLNSLGRRQTEVAAPCTVGRGEKVHHQELLIVVLGI